MFGSIFFRKVHSTLYSTRVISNESFVTDSYTNVTPKIISFLNKNLHNQKGHPICLLKERIIQFFNKKFINRRGNSIFTVCDSLNPIVTAKQNFDSLLVPENHPSRLKSDCYYLNKNFLLRGHMTAHQSELIRMGLNNFLMVGDVFRRDSIDSTHYPVFHQLDGVRLLTTKELFLKNDNGKVILNLSEKGNGVRTKEKQEAYTLEATQMVEQELKATLESLIKELFGPKIQYKWVEAYFPFTHPSWELEISLNGSSWVELLGCGIMEHQILFKSGCDKKIGWAFGLGLERLAMHYYSIPDIRIFWTNDSGFLHQFEGKDCTERIKFKPVSIYPACAYNISFWVNDNFSPNDFYEIARQVCGDEVEQITLVDKYCCYKTGRLSYCFKVVYRSLVKTFTKKELNVIHGELEKKVTKELNVEVR